MTEKKVKKIEYYYATGTNKTSTATIRLFSGKGETLINNKSLSSYASSKEMMNSILDKPFILTGTKDNFYFSAKTKGGGYVSQLKAISLAISRALSKINDEYKKTLAQYNLLRRDPRMVERKKYYKVKSRKAPQYSKR